MERRTFIATLGAGLFAGCSGGSGSGGGSGGADASYGDWFEGVDNYDGEIDRTGQSETTVTVGVDDGLAYDPAAIRISPGTTVVWEWTGKGGGHNVIAENDAFRSDLADEAGHTFRHEFPDPGLFPYFCEPHRTLGMKGGVRVVSDQGDS